MKLKCLIVDDEPIARQIIENYCSHLDSLQVIASCSDALKARAILEKQEIHLIFLDINMPVLDGIAFSKTLRMPPLIVFTTAYKEFAHEAFNLNACDYLLKPFSFERFIQAVDKAKEKAAITQVALPEQGINVFTYVRAEGKIFKIDFNKLKYAEARGNNVRIVMDGYQFLPAMTFNRLEELLPKAVFSRVHRSFIVNKSRIQLIEGNRIFIDDTEIPIGTHYRERFLKEIGIKGL